MYEVFGTVESRAFRVMWALEELGQPYKLTYAKPRSPALTEVYPKGKIPALRVGEDVIGDSTAIMTYLGDVHSGLLAAAGTIERAKQDGIVQAIIDELDAVLWTAARHSFVLPEEQRVPEVKPALKWEFNRNISRMADQITTPFAAGDTFTIADILLTHCLNWAKSAKFDVENEKMLAYADTMRAHDAYKKVLAQA
jgi:glutathione S-transferase